MLVSQKYLLACHKAWSERMEGAIADGAPAVNAASGMRGLEEDGRRFGILDEDAFVRIEKRIAVAIAGAIEASRDDIEAAGAHALEAVTRGRTYQFSLVKQLAVGAGAFVSRRLEVAVLRASAVALRVMARTDHRRHAPGIGPWLDRLEAGGIDVRPELVASVNAYRAQGARFEEGKAYAAAYRSDLVEGPYGDVLAAFSRASYIVRVQPMVRVEPDDVPYEGEFTAEEADGVDPDLMEPASRQARR